MAFIVIDPNKFQLGIFDTFEKAEDYLTGFGVLVSSHYWIEESPGVWSQDSYFIVRSE